jgi:hypothetical protein
MVLSVWQAITLLLGLISAFYGVWRQFLSLYEKRQDERYKVIEAAQTALSQRVDKISAETLRRDDWLRETVTMQRQLDLLQQGQSKLLDKFMNSPRVS